MIIAGTVGPAATVGKVEPGETAHYNAKPAGTITLKRLKRERPAEFGPSG